MIRFVQVMVVGVGGKEISFRGREPFRVADEEQKKALLGVTGLFTEQKDGTMKFTAPMTILDKHGKKHKLPDDGCLELELQDLPDNGQGVFV